jgi:protein-S-isoprenylcysteine O-methyltransferase Ste14
MIEGPLNFFMVLSGLVLAVAVFTALFFISAPYGRHARTGWGPSISNKYGWMIMEAPAVLVFVICFAFGSVPRNLPIFLFFTLWELHYIHRALVYPFTIRDGHKKMPVAVMLMGFAFNLGNAYVNGRYLFTFSGGYAQHWPVDARLLSGTALFLAGLIINRWADLSLRGLRLPGQTDYHIPYGGLFRWISCPNYLGEIIQWFGWALATWSLPGLAFAIWTTANLAPRARSNHRWYHANFPDYPAERKALIPWVW